MSTDATDNGCDGDIDTGTKSDTVPRAEPLSKAKQPFYRRYTSLFKNVRLGTEVTAPKPAVKLSPRNWISFASLGVDLLGRSTPIDDRQNTVRDGIAYMSSVSKESTEELNMTAVTLLSNKRPRATEGQFLARPTHELLEKYPFARMIPEQLPTSNLPNATLVFERLLSSNDVTTGVGHPNCMSSMTFAFASIISLSLVRVKDEKPEYNETSPFLDLSPLYGVSDAETNLVRAKDGRGMLYPDCFYEDRVMSLPRAVSVLMILWNRNHNYIARHLLLNNEGKKWVDPLNYPISSNGILGERLADQDDEIFRKARAINCIHFKNVVSEDFLKVLIGLPNVGKSANLNILIDIKQSEKGNGCDSMLEFSLLYNWSALMGPVDIGRLGEDFDTNPNRQQRNHPGLIRSATGRFNDDDLARELQDATENAAGTPGARRISSAFRTAEIMTIERARRQGVTSLNQLRKFLGLKELKSFDEWNSNPEIAQAAKELYGNIDNLELYVGLQAEEISPGSGLNFGYTMTYGLLVDLIAIIRSDPCFTTELTPDNLTRWGYGDCMATPNNGAFCAMTPRLLQRNLSRNYAYDNIYTLFPLTCPNETSQRLVMDIITPQDLYDFERPKPRHVVPVETMATISYVFNSPKFKTIYDTDLKTLTSGHGYFLGIDDKMRHDQELMMTMFSLIPDNGALARYAAYFETAAAELISTQAKNNNGHQTVDIVKDVINVTCTRWVCETLCGLRLDSGIDAATDMHDKFGALFAFIFRNIDPENGWASREVALQASEDLRRRIAAELPNLTTEPDKSYLDFIRTTVTSVSELLLRVYRELQPEGVKLSQQSAQTFLDRVVKSAKNFPLDKTPFEGDGELIDLEAYEKKVALLERSRSIANVLGLAVVISVNYAQACAQAVDFYLDEQYSEERKEIIRLSTLSPAEARKQDANKKIMGYIREAQRLGQPLGLWREAREDDNIPQENDLPPIPVKAGDRIFADFNKAHTNCQDFLYPDSVEPNRKTPSIQGMGLHKCPGLGFVDHTMPELFKAIFRLKNLRRDPGKAGRLERLVLHLDPTQTDPKFFMDSTGEISHFPRSLTLLFDGGSHEGPALKAKKRKSWKVNFGSSTKSLRNAADRWIRHASVLLLVIMLFFILAYVYSRAPPVHLPSAQRPSVLRWIWRSPYKARRRSAPPPPKPSDIVAVAGDCPSPTTVFQPWDINTFVLGEDGHPVPIEYTLDHPKPHRLSVVDIDVMDTQMAIYVDNKLRGVTRDFELDKANSCGESQGACVKGGFSGGVVVVGPGNHTVKIDWIGKEYANGTHDADWGEERGRRIKWKREYCA